MRGGLAAAAGLVFVGAHRSIPARAARIGFINGEGYPELVAAFESELSHLGYVEGRNITVERRISRTNTSDAVAQCAELAHMNLNLVLVTALPFAMLIRAANPNMPMVVMTAPGFVSNGFEAEYLINGSAAAVRALTRFKIGQQLGQVVE